jgi:hypothetical protein
MKIIVAILRLYALRGISCQMTLMSKKSWVMATSLHQLTILRTRHAVSIECKRLIVELEIFSSCIMSTKN